MAGMGILATSMATRATTSHHRLIRSHTSSTRHSLQDKSTNHSSNRNKAAPNSQNSNNNNNSSSSSSSSSSKLCPQATPLTSNVRERASHV